MQWTDRIRQVKILLVVAAVLIAVTSLLVSHYLVKDLSNEERQKMEIDFNKIEELSFPGMNGGTGLMTVRMYNDEKYRIIPTTIHSGGSIGMHRQTSGDDMNYILSGIGRAICDGVEEELRPGVLHICPKGSEHSIINTGTEDLVLFTIVVAR